MRIDPAFPSPSNGRLAAAEGFDIVPFFLQRLGQKLPSHSIIIDDQDFRCLHDLP
jgi:hypothetical protein